MDDVVGELLVGSEAVARQDFVYLLDTDEAVGVDLLLRLVPEQLFGVELLTFDVHDVHMSAQVPQLELVVIVGGVCLHLGIDAHQVVIFLQVDALLERPFAGVDPVVHVPLLGNDFVSDDSGV